MTEYFKNAIASIWGNKVRSLLTVVGVIIGVTSVTVLISLGQGLKNDVSGLIQGLGTNVIFILSGKIDTSNPQAANQTNPANFLAGDILTLNDVRDIKANPEIEAVSPMSLVTGDIKYNDKSAVPTIAGVYPEARDAFQVLQIDKGKMFSDQDPGNVIVLGSNTTQTLFGDADPIGKSVTLGKDGQFTVVGTVAKNTKTSSFTSELDALALIPFSEATKLNKDQVKIFRIVAKAKGDADVKNVKTQLKDAILTNHEGEENFSVLTQDDVLDVFGQFLNLATLMVSGIAAISLIVGGIGIMNIMLVTVTERTKEIGLRKAVGATSSAIALQFLIEAIIITMLGGIIGLGISATASAIIAWQTDLTPQITMSTVLLAIGISTIVGIIFGLWPALRAAKKDPIDALRYE